MIVDVSPEAMVPEALVAVKSVWSARSPFCEEARTLVA